MNVPALVFDRVSKNYGRGALILDAVSFEVRPGEFFGLAGVNGAGKTSLIKCA
ncbi:MAG: ATP-binding cassette domain-containing protein, partial [Burkholderiales bacterium]